MTDRARVAVVVAVLAFLHFTLRPVFEEWYASPNLLVCGLLLSARQVRPAAAAIIGFALGLLEDAVAVSYFGFSAVALVLLGYVGSRTRDLFVGEETLFIGAYVFLGTWAFEAVSRLLLLPDVPVLFTLFVHAPLAGLSTAVVGYVVRPIMRPR